MTTKDTIYASQRRLIERFSFDEQVVNVFPDMIRRSVPGYGTIVEMTGVLALHYAQPDTAIFDLGCSLGASSLAIASLVDQQNCTVRAIDNSQAMIESAKQLLVANELKIPVEFQLADIRDMAFEPCSFAVMNFTLQFLPLDVREHVIKRLASSMIDGGAFVLSEKITFDDPQQDALQQSLHHDFKRNNGYSDMEISQKRSALEEVLIPETLEAHQQRLLSAGFKKVELWFRCFNFVSMVAFK